MVTSRIPVAKLGGIYKRLETDEEYARRLDKAGCKGVHGHPATEHRGQSLDELGNRHGLQRRIIESSVD